MRWEDARESSNIEDRRGGDGGFGGGGGGSGMAVGGGSLGIGTIVILGLISYALGIDPRVLIGGAEMVENARHGGGQMQQADRPADQPQRQTATPADQMGRFVAAILGEDEDVWREVLPAQKGVRFQDAKLVLFDGATESACGTAQSAMGPFYCPNDRKIYLDTSFFQDMQRKFGGGGDFAYAYVISHEMGHHIQNLLGILPKVRRAQEAAQSQGQANGYSVRLELQADCFAGVWAANANKKWNNIDPSDIQKAINTAQSIGDDRLQQATRGRVVPDSFTHGSSAQRVKWLQTGLGSGQIDSCNTFAQ